MRPRRPPRAGARHCWNFAGRILAHRATRPAAAPRPPAQARSPPLPQSDPGAAARRSLNSRPQGAVSSVRVRGPPRKRRRVRPHGGEPDPKDDTDRRIAALTEHFEAEGGGAVRTQAACAADEPRPRPLRLKTHGGSIECWVLETHDAWRIVRCNRKVRTPTWLPRWRCP